MEYVSMVWVMMTSMRECVTRDCTEVWEMVGSMRYMMDYKEVWGMMGSMVKFKMRELLMTRDKREL